MERVHLVRQGEHLARIARRYRVDPDAIWEHPANGELAARRKSPNILLPGDRLHIPDATTEVSFELEAGSTNRFVGRLPTVTVSIVFRGADGPLAGEPFVVRGLAEELQGTTDGEGTAVFEVPVDTGDVTLLFERLDREHRVEVGGLDPLDEPTGIAQRLAQLGYAGITWESALGRATRTREDAAQAALQAFQADRGLLASGVPDDETLAALGEGHGS